VRGVVDEAEVRAGKVKILALEPSLSTPSARMSSPAMPKTIAVAFAIWDSIEAAVLDKSVADLALLGRVLVRRLVGVRHHQTLDMKMGRPTIVSASDVYAKCLK
jgi:hypothetical protein